VFGVFPILALGYVALCVLARAGYRFLLYPAPNDPALVPPVGAKVLALRAEDGATVVAVQIPPLQASVGSVRRTVVVFHGNGETVGRSIDMARELAMRGLGVVLVEYRGYGESRRAARPSERGLYHDAAAVLEALREQGIDRREVVLLGHSLGTGVAAEMARQGRAAGLVLVSPYTSISAMARRVAPILPAAWLCPDRFDTLGKAAEIKVPTLVVHGDADATIPVAMGRKVAAAINNATLHIVPGGGHCDLLTRPSMIAMIAQFATAE
jgi:pimeloyl-ACP methyl ester carboxylesterase